MQAAPGWFPDPWGVAALRYWDGAQWTAHLSVPAVPANPYAHEVARHRPTEARLRTWAPVAAGAWAVLAVAQLLTNASAARSFRNEFQAIRNASVTGGPPAVHFPFAWDGSLLGLLGLAVAVAFLRWQHSAASVARGLGYPARVSPGLGVGGWFIPFGNFWLPYQSLVDCLPPDHPARAQCLYSWLAFMAFTVIQGAAFSVALLGGPVIPLVVVAAALLAASVGIGWSCVAAIEADHARAAGAARPGW